MAGRSVGVSSKGRCYAAGAALAGVLALTGCLGSAGDHQADVKVSAVQAIGLASKKTAAVDSYKVDMTVGGTGRSVPALHGTVQVRLRPDLAANATLDRANVGGFSVPGGARAILLGDDLYAKLPEQVIQFMGGKPWVRFPISRAGAGINVDELVKQANPADQMKIFTDSKDVRRVGEETIDGVETTHYKGTVSPREAVARLDPKSRESLDGLYGRAGDRRVGFDLWVDRGSLPRKLVSSFATPDGRATSTMIFSAYNQRFTVTAPPADQVADGTRLGHTGIPG
jgi:hypothetical protein